MFTTEKICVRKALIRTNICKSLKCNYINQTLYLSLPDIWLMYNIYNYKTVSNTIQKNMEQITYANSLK